MEDTRRNLNCAKSRKPVLEDLVSFFIQFVFRTFIHSSVAHWLLRVVDKLDILGGLASELVKDCEHGM